jgi:hypothetical protein
MIGGDNGVDSTNYPLSSRSTGGGRTGNISPNPSNGSDGAGNGRTQRASGGYTGNSSPTNGRGIRGRFGGTQGAPSRNVVMNSLQSTGNAQADADIATFYKIRDNMLKHTRAEPYTSDT